MMVLLWEKKQIANFSLHKFYFNLNYIYMAYDKYKHLYIVQDQGFHWT